MKITAVIGKNFGDEGKGLVSAYLCRNSDRALVVKHNGGGQAGHTVEGQSGSFRFVHHQVGSGAEYGADTLFAATFHPDLYQLGKEISEFKNAFGFTPAIYAEPEAEITTLGDVLLNMGAETSRGDGRHGSCGMGINECCERNKKGFHLSIRDVIYMDTSRLADRLLEIYEKYTIKRMAELGITPENDYYRMLHDKKMLISYAYEIKENTKYITACEADKSWLYAYEDIIFESGQGLLLDEDYKRFAPHLTASKTGCRNVLLFLGKRNMKLDEAIYVTRSYVTKHGAGPLPCECKGTEIAALEIDKTNQPNEWQGTLRFAKHPGIGAFTEPLIADAGQVGFTISLAITHLNETCGKICFEDNDMEWRELAGELRGKVDRVYVSRDHENIDQVF